VVSLERRLSRLEEQSRLRGAAAAAADEREKDQWLARARLRRQEEIDSGTRRCRDLIRLFNTQGILPAMSEDEVTNRILDWRPALRELTPAVAKREVFRAVYNRSPGTDHLRCPPEWAESFEAADQLLQRFMGIPDELLAEGFTELLRIDGEGADEEALRQWSDRYEEPFGITEGLTRRAVGCDVDKIPPEERDRRLGEILTDFVYGPKGYEVQRRMAQLRKKGQK
jgi:hypothetical protein